MTNPKIYLEYITKKCQEANPRISNFNIYYSAYCDYKHTEEEYSSHGIEPAGTNEVGPFYNIDKFAELMWKKGYRSIVHFEDILVTMQKNEERKDQIYIDLCGTWWYDAEDRVRPAPSINGKDIAPEYDLSKPLSEQSPETLEWIAEQLGYNEPQ